MLHPHVSPGAVVVVVGVDAVRGLADVPADNDRLEVVIKLIHQCQT